jgi:thymidylate synthase (FAD)
MINCKVIGVTKPVVDFIPDSEDIISFCARVSNPSNQTQFDTSEKLLRYCVRNSHWSVFETVSLTMEIECPRDIARQILRHRSFSFQEFSQRYAEATSFITRECRLQDTTNRQNSTEINDDELASWWEDSQNELLTQIDYFYKKALEKGIAKEVARCILPEGLTMSKMYMNGTVRSWLHYIDLRQDNGTQKEHREVALKCKEVIKEYFPTLIEMLGKEKN